MQEVQQIKLFLVTKYNIYESGSSSQIIAFSVDDSNFFADVDYYFKNWYSDLDTDTERISYTEIKIKNGSFDAQCYDFVNDKINQFFKPSKF